MNQVTYAFLITTLAGLSTMIGSLLIFYKKKTDNIITTSLAFASGVMVCVSITDLIPESISSLKMSFYIIPSILISLIFIVIGIIFALAVLKKAENSNEVINESEKSEGKNIAAETEEEIVFFSPLSCVISYMEKMTHGYIDDMLNMIPKQEIELGKQYEPDILSNYKNFYSTLIKNNGVYGNEISVEISYDDCLEYDLLEFLEFIGVSEETIEEKLGIAADYLTGYRTYYIYTGVKYAGIDMNTGDISTYTSWQPADYIIIGEKDDNYSLVGELLLKFN